MSRTRRVLRGFATDLAGQIILTFASFAMAPLILSHMSPMLYGFWLTALSLLSYVGFADIGLGLAFMQAVALRANRTDDDGLNRLISTGFVAFVGTGSLIAAAGLCLAPWIPGWFHIPAGEAASVTSAYCVAVIATALAVPGSVYNGVICGFQRMATDNLLRTFAALAGLLFTVLLLWLGWGLMALALATLLTTLITVLLAAHFAYRCHPGLRIRPSLFNVRDFRELLNFGGYFQLGKVANTVAFNSSSVVISGTLGAQLVTPFVFTSKLAMLFSFTLASKLTIAAFPALTQMFAAQDVSGLQSVTLRLTAYSTRLALLGASVFLVCNEQFVTLWVGAGQFGGAALTAVFCYWILQDCLYRGSISILFAAGKLRIWALWSVAEVILNIVLSVILARSFGLLGVALGTALSKTVTTAWVVPLLICQQMQLGFRSYLWASIAKPALASTATPVIAVLLAWITPVEFGWFRLCLIGVGTLLAAILPFEGLAFCKAPAKSWKTLHSLIR